MTELGPPDLPRASLVSRNRSRLTGDTAATVIAHGAGLVATLLLTPIQLSRMGYTDYGLVSLAVAVVGVFSFLDYGLSWSALRYLPGLSGARRGQTGNEVASLLLTLALIVGLVVATTAAVITAIGYAAGKSAFGLDNSRLGVIGVSVLLFPALMTTNVLSNVARAVGQFRTAALIFGAYFVSTNVVWAIAAGRAHDVELVLGWQVVFSACSALFWYLRIRRTGFPALRLFPHLAKQSLDLRRPLLVFAGFAALSGLSSTLFLTADKIAFAAGAGVHQLPLYTIAAALCSRIGIVSAALTSVIFPQLSAAHSAADTEGYAALTAWAIRATTLLTASVGAALFWAGDKFLSLWISPHFAAQSATILRVLVVGFALEAAGQLGYSANDARGRIRRSMVSGFACASVGLLGGGLTAAAWGLTAGATVFAAALAAHGTIGLLFGFGRPRWRPLARALSYVIPAFVVVGAAQQFPRAYGGSALTTLTVAIAAALGVLAVQLRDVLRRRLRSAVH